MSVTTIIDVVIFTLFEGGTVLEAGRC